MDAPRDGAGVLKIDVLRRDLHIVQSGLDVGMTHQLHECRQAHPGAHHIRGEGVSAMVGSSRVDLQACKLEYSIVSPK